MGIEHWCSSFCCLPALLLWADWVPRTVVFYFLGLFCLDCFFLTVTVVCRSFCVAQPWIRCHSSVTFAVEMRPLSVTWGSFP